MTIGSSASLNDVATGVAVNADKLARVIVRNLEAEDYNCIEDLIEERGCYRNSILAGASLGACAVVYGVAAFEDGFYVEHCWLRIDSTHYDPTYQALGAIDDATYFSLLEISLDDYVNVTHQLGRSGMVINMHDLRMSPRYSQYFLRNARNSRTSVGGF